MSAFAALINTDRAPLDESLLRALSGVTQTQVRIDGCVGMATASIAAGFDGGPSSADSPVWAVIDGRLDDREGLVAALAASHRQADLRCVPDAALLVYAYEKWGHDCVSHMLGDFSFCLWDARDRRLLCARDHFGVKPLYYARVGNVLVVSSVLRWLRCHPALSRTLRHEAIGDFLLFGVCAEPSQTAFLDISRVPPAHRLSYSLELDSSRVDRYWALESGDCVRFADPREYVEQFSHLLRVAVVDRTRTERVGVLMSGGLDSSSVAAIATDAMGPAASDRLRAFTVVYDTLMNDEERDYSSVVAKSLGISISHISADRYQPFDRWDDDSLPPEPSLEGLMAAMLDVLDVVSHHGNAVLTGDGGDPMLLPSSVIDQVGRTSVASLAADLLRAWRLRVRPPFGIRSRIARWGDDSEDVPAWLGRDLLQAFDPRGRWQQMRCKRTAESGARSTAVSDVMDPWWTSTFESFDPGATQRPVELRYPFFDVRLASFALQLPSIPWCLNKHVLRETMRGRLPESVRTRSKTPLPGSPIEAGKQWSSQRAVELFENTPEIRAFIDVRKFGAMVNGDSLLSNESLGAWAAISLAMWLRCDAMSAVSGMG